jgi:hypothetical protein
MDNMKIGADAGKSNIEMEKIVVSIRVAGPQISGKRKGKQGYETVESIDVSDAQPSEVVAAVLAGLRAAANSKK